MKMEAMSRQGARFDITCGTECHKSDAADAAGKRHVRKSENLLD